MLGSLLYVVGPVVLRFSVYSLLLLAVFSLATSSADNLAVVNRETDLSLVNIAENRPCYSDSARQSSCLKLNNGDTSDKIELRAHRESIAYFKQRDASWVALDLEGLFHIDRVALYFPEMETLGKNVDINLFHSPEPLNFQTHQELVKSQVPRVHVVEPHNGRMHEVTVNGVGRYVRLEAGSDTDRITLSELKVFAEPHEAPTIDARRLESAGAAVQGGEFAEGAGGVLAKPNAVPSPKYMLLKREAKGKEQVVGLELNRPDTDDIGSAIYFSRKEALGPLEEAESGVEVLASDASEEDLSSLSLVVKSDANNVTSSSSSSSVKHQMVPITPDPYPSGGLTHRLPALEGGQMGGPAEETWLIPVSRPILETTCLALMLFCLVVIVWSQCSTALLAVFAKLVGTSAKLVRSRWPFLIRNKGRGLDGHGLATPDRSREALNRELYDIHEQEAGGPMGSDWDGNRHVSCHNPSASSARRFSNPLSNLYHLSSVCGGGAPSTSSSRREHPDAHELPNAAGALNLTVSPLRPPSSIEMGLRPSALVEEEKVGSAVPPPFKAEVQADDGVVAAPAKPPLPSEATSAPCVPSSSRKEGRRGSGRGSRQPVPTVQFLWSSPLSCEASAGAHPHRGASVGVNDQFYPLETLDTQREYACLREAAAQRGKGVAVEYRVATEKELIALFGQHPERSRLLHLAAHGERDALILEDGFGNGQRMAVSDLKALIAKFGAHVQFAFLNSCDSVELGDALVEVGVRHVVCTRCKVGDKASAQFTRAFYGGLFGGKSVGDAFELAVHSLRASPERAVRREAANYALLPSPHSPAGKGDHSAVFFPLVPLSSQKDKEKEQQKEAETGSAMSKPMGERDGVTSSSRGERGDRDRAGGRGRGEGRHVGSVAVFGGRSRRDRERESRKSTKCTTGSSHGSEVAEAGGAGKRNCRRRESLRGVSLDAYGGTLSSSSSCQRRPGHMHGGGSAVGVFNQHRHRGGRSSTKIFSCIGQSRREAESLTAKRSVTDGHPAVFGKAGERESEREISIPLTASSGKKKEIEEDESLSPPLSHVRRPLIAVDIVGSPSATEEEVDEEDGRPSNVSLSLSVLSEDFEKPPNSHSAATNQPLLLSLPSSPELLTTQQSVQPQPLALPLSHTSPSCSEEDDSSDSNKTPSPTHSAASVNTPGRRPPSSPTFALPPRIESLPSPAVTLNAKDVTNTGVPAGPLLPVGGVRRVKTETPFEQPWLHRLPAPPEPFGRKLEVNSLVRQLVEWGRRAVLVCDGDRSKPRGSGKSALLQFTSRFCAVRDWFPAGVLFLDLENAQQQGGCGISEPDLLLGLLMRSLRRDPKLSLRGWSRNIDSVVHELVERGRGARRLLVIDSADRILASENGRRVLGHLLRDVDGLHILMAARVLRHVDLGHQQLHVCRLAQLDPLFAARLFLSRCRRPLHLADFLHTDDYDRLVQISASSSAASASAASASESPEDRSLIERAQRLSEMLKGAAAQTEKPAAAPAGTPQQQQMETAGGVQGSHPLQHHAAAARAKLEGLLAIHPLMGVIDGHAATITAVASLVCNETRSLYDLIPKAQLLIATAHGNISGAARHLAPSSVMPVSVASGSTGTGGGGRSVVGRETSAGATSVASFSSLSLSPAPCVNTSSSQDATAVTPVPGGPRGGGIAQGLPLQQQQVKEPTDREPVLSVSFSDFTPADPTRCCDMSLHHHHHHTDGSAVAGLPSETGGLTVRAPCKSHLEGLAWWGGYLLQSASEGAGGSRCSSSSVVPEGCSVEGGMEREEHEGVAMDEVTAAMEMELSFDGEEGEQEEKGSVRREETGMSRLKFGLEIGEATSESAGAWEEPVVLSGWEESMQTGPLRSPFPLSPPTLSASSFALLAEAAGRLRGTEKK
uniref:CHAT domain-containing protein n=1 Tax=Chromera velia CCMP2878 TaxID=1169474 RepID=A0A0G4HFC8_9ALVE|eukprot:Cvel_994.t1-p1 / transcript=Cvel_994.t1 / gene=Cvel_994 / organism=Chromera_velia_CCMP2878 / gene_product=hypothetical protein / transcript_product=hypothetical protein / location=Cvel_scaffold32:93912-101133(-) / protein_length=1884 / sequence_SO=supercontig / SO=protein_coding / is_pseudo=false